MSAEIQSQVVRRNFQLGVVNGLLFLLAETLMDPTLVLVAFVSHLTHSPLLLGLVVPLRDGSWFLPQLWVASYQQRQPRKLRLYNRMAVVRVVGWTLLATSVFIIKDSRWLLAAFFLAFGTSALAAGFSGLPFLEVVAKTVPPKRRGEFFAWRQTVGGLAGVGASFVVRWLLDEQGPLAFPYNFGVLFALGLLSASLGLAAFARVVEPPDRPAPQRVPLLAQLRRARQFVRADSNYRHFLFLRSALMVAGAATPFFAVFVQQQLGGSLSMVGVYLATATGSSLLANISFARFSARLGNRRTLLIAAGMGLVMTARVLALVLLAGPLSLSGRAASLWLIPVFVLSGIRESGIGVAGQSLLMDIAPPAERSLYMGFTSTWLGVVLLATGGSGLIVARFGFGALIVLAFAASLFALYAALRVEEVAHAPLAEADLTQAISEVHPAP